MEFFNDQRNITKAKKEDRWKKEITEKSETQVELDRFIELLFGYKPRINIELEEVYKDEEKQKHQEQAIKDGEEDKETNSASQAIEFNVSQPTQNPNIGVIVNFKNVCLN